MDIEQFHIFTFLKFIFTIFSHVVTAGNLVRPLAAFLLKSLFLQKKHKSIILIAI